MKTRRKAKTGRKCDEASAQNRLRKKPTRSKGKAWRFDESRRLRVAKNTLVVFMCTCLLFALLGIWERAARKTSVAEYLLSQSAPEKSDPLHLVGSVAGLEVTGISKDGAVIGYASNLPCVQSASQVKAALQANGWALVDDNGQGILSFQQHSDDPSVGSRLLVQYVAAGQGSAYVAQRW